MFNDKFHFRRKTAKLRTGQLILTDLGRKNFCICISQTRQLTAIAASSRPDWKATNFILPAELLPCVFPPRE